MKKFSLLIMSLMCLVLTGCGSKSLDLNKVSENLDSLTSGEFDLLTAVENIEMNPEYFNEELTVVYDFDLEELEIDSELVEDMAFRVDSNNNPAYIIVKPVDGKKDELKSQINSYLNQFEDLNKLETEYAGHLIYSFSDKNDEILKTIKNSKARIFGMLMEVTKDDVEVLTGVNPEDLEEFLIKNSVMTQASSYYILKPKSGKKEAVKEVMNNYMTTVEENWKTYLPDQYELVKNRLEEEYGEYLIYIIASDNELVYNTIKECEE